MRKNKVKESVNRAFQHLEKVFHSFLSPLLIHLSQESKKVPRGSKKPQVFAYRLLGEKIIRLLPLFKDLDVNLQRARLGISFRGYVSLAVLATLLASVSTLVTVTFVALLPLRLSISSSLVFGVGATLFAGASMLIGFYAYPLLRADSLKRNLEDGLPFTVGYLSILAGSGVPPAQMLRSLAQIDSSSAVSQEAKLIVRDVELFGVDVISALESASKRTPSGKFKEFLEGFIATVHSGGDLTRYLSERARLFMRLQRIALRRLADTLGVLAEFYVVLLVAGPLILVVMLAVMAMLGGSGVTGMFDPRLLLNLLTYLGIPLGSIVFLILLDMIMPKR